MKRGREVTDHGERGQIPYPESVLTVQNLRIVESVSRHCNFSRAADELGVSQPYISNQISELETRLRLTLFRRVGRRVYLTEAGTLLYQHAQALLNKLRETEQSLAQLREVIIGRLDLAAGIIVAESILPPILGGLRAKHPEIVLNLRVYGSKLIEEAVADGRYELGLSLSHRAPPDLQVEEFGSDELVVVAGKTHRFARGDIEIVAPDEIAKEPLLIREPTSGTRIFIESRFRDVGIDLQHSLELNSNQVIKALVEHNIGIAILSTRAIEREVASGQLKALRVKGMNLRRPLSLISRRNHDLSRPALAFRSALLSAFSA